MEVIVKCVTDTHVRLLLSRHQLFPPFCPSHASSYCCSPTGLVCLNCGKIHVALNSLSLPFLSAQFSSVKNIHTAFSRAFPELFHFTKLKLYTH